jgi:hypothetical protein
MRAVEPDKTVRLFSLQATDKEEMDNWHQLLNAIFAEHQTQKEDEMELRRLEEQRAAARSKLQATGIAVALEPELEPTSFAAAHMAAPEIAMKMKGKHLAALIDRDTAPLKEGWLSKQSGNADVSVKATDKLSFGNVHHKWDRRWFVMQHHFLYYFEKEQDFEAYVPPKGAIPVAAAKVNRSASGDTQERSTFRVAAHYGDGNRTFVLRAELEQDAIEWVAGSNI